MQAHETNVHFSPHPSRTWQSSTQRITNESPYWPLKKAIWKSRGLRGNVGTVGSPSAKRTPLLTQVPIHWNVTIWQFNIAFCKTILTNDFYPLTEDIDPSVGRFRNMVQTAVIPMKVGVSFLLRILFKVRYCYHSQTFISHSGLRCIRVTCLIPQKVMQAWEVKNAVLQLMPEHIN